MRRLQSSLVLILTAALLVCFVPNALGLAQQCHNMRTCLSMPATMRMDQPSPHCLTRPCCMHITAPPLALTFPAPTLFSMHSVVRVLPAAAGPASRRITSAVSSGFLPSVFHPPSA